MFGSVRAVVTYCPARWRQQADALVIPDRLHLRVGGRSQFSNRQDTFFAHTLDPVVATGSTIPPLSPGTTIMSDHCCSHHHVADPGADPVRRATYRRVLWCALAINLGMFLVEILASVAASSASLQADAVDFLGDTANYAISLFVIGMALRYRATAALIKGLTMAGMGLSVLITIGWHLVHATVPEAVTMGAVGIAALVANAMVFGLLWAYRTGDANMRSVWLCSRNDVLGNLAVLLAALGVFGTGRGWPDLIVACIMAALALQGAWAVVTQAVAELRATRQPVAVAAE
jgi:Co/Zn/Cd efflux system component